MEQLYQDLNFVSSKQTADSVHLSKFPKSDSDKIDEDLEQKMDLAQKITTMALSLRKKEKVRVRQPLQKIMILVKDCPPQLELHGGARTPPSQGPEAAAAHDRLATTASRNRECANQTNIQ